MFWHFDWQEEGQLNGAEFAFNPRSTQDRVRAMKVQNRLSSSSRRLLPSIPGSRNDGDNYRRRRTHRRFCSLNRRNHFHRRENFRSRPPAALRPAPFSAPQRLRAPSRSLNSFLPPLLCFAPDSHHRHHRRRRHHDHGGARTSASSRNSAKSRRTRSRRAGHTNLRVKGPLLRLCRPGIMIASGTQRCYKINLKQEMNGDAA